MQVSILKGAFFDTAGNIRPSLPVNMWPVIGESGFSKGYLRTAPGLTRVAAGPGQDRGALVWEGVHYRVMGSKLCSVAGNAVTQLADVGNDAKPAKLDFGFGFLVIYSAGNVYYWNGAALTQVVDPNIGNGPPIDVCWIDGYYMLTDGVSLYVTNLADPTQLLPNAYEQPGEDATPVVAVMRIRDEVYAVTTNSIQNFQDVGGLNFPFQANPAGLIPKGAVGTRAVCYYLDTLAFVGGARNEAPSVYLAGFGQAVSISTPEVDRQLAALTTDQLAAIEVEGLTEEAEQRLLVHLPTGTLVYHRQASLVAEQPIWTWLAAGAAMNQPYPARHFAAVGGVFYGGGVGGVLGQLDETTNSQLGEVTTCQWDTLFLYNGGKGGILKSAELVGSAGVGTALMSWTRDGKTWSAQQSIAIGSAGPVPTRMQWRPKTRMWNFMGLRFQLPAAVVAAFGALEVDIEPLNA